MSAHRIVVFGDSVAYGAWDSEGGWVDRLRRWAHRVTIESAGETKLQVFNLGIGGDTSTGIARRIEAELAARQSASWPLAIIISYGANDECTTDGTIETDLETFQANTRRIIAAAQQCTDTLIFVGSPRLAEQVLNFKGREYSDERLAAYEAAQREIVEAAGIPFVEVRSLFITDDLYAFDRIHPNDAGHTVIFDAVKAKLSEIL